MSIESDVKNLIKIEDIIKEGLEDEVKVMQNLYAELISGLKQLKDIISQTDFEGQNTERRDDILNPIRDAIESFISELSPLDNLDARFAKIKEHSLFLIEKLGQFKNSLGVYGSKEKANIDFETNILFDFKTTVLRDFEHDIAFNKRIEEALK